MDTSQGTTNPVARYAPTEYTLPASYTCDFTEFKLLLVNLRKSNDNFKFILNKMNSTSQCEEIWKQINKVMTFRRDAINTCLTQTNEDLARLQTPSASTTANPTNTATAPKTTAPTVTDINLMRARKHLMGKVDLLKGELDIEDILQHQTEKLYHRACTSNSLSFP